MFSMVMTDDEGWALFRALAPCDLPSRSKLNSCMSRILWDRFVLPIALSTTVFLSLLRNRYMNCVARAFSGGVSMPFFHERARMLIMYRAVNDDPWLT